MKVYEVLAERVDERGAQYGSRTFYSNLKKTVTELPGWLSFERECGYIFTIPSYSTISLHLEQHGRAFFESLPLEGTVYRVTIRRCVVH